MVLVLPALPRGSDASPAYLDFSARNTPPAGGASITILRPGRMACTVSIPPLDAKCAQKWLAVQLGHKATGEPVNLTLQRPRDQASIPGVTADTGLPAVGAGGGTALAVIGPIGTKIDAGTLFSFAVSPAIHFLHMVTASLTLGVDGKGVLPVSPMLHATPNTGTPINFDAPVIQGNFDTGNVAWTLQRLRWIGVEFNITEVF